MRTILDHDQNTLLHSALQRVCRCFVTWRHELPVSERSRLPRDFPGKTIQNPRTHMNPIQTSQQSLLTSGMSMPKWQQELEEGSRLSLIRSFAVYLENTFLEFMPCSVFLEPGKHNKCKSASFGPLHTLSKTRHKGNLLFISHVCRNSVWPLPDSCTTDLPYTSVYAGGTQKHAYTPDRLQTSVIFQYCHKGKTMQNYLEQEMP